MAKRGEVTAGQIAEMTNWLRRLTPDEYQARRGLLRRATDPKYALGPKLLWPFKDERPLEWGWKGVEREGALCGGPIDISRLEVVPFHEDGELWVPGEEMMRRARDAKNFPGCSEWSQHHAEQLLLQAAELPKEWACESGPALLFPDTTLLDEFGFRYVPYLVWDDGEWRLRWLWLVFDFNRFCRFLRLRPSTSRCGASK